MKRSTLPSRIAGDVAQHGVMQWALVQAVDGHDREKLLDGPTVGNRLEDREIAEVGLGQEGVERVQLFGHLFGLPEQAADLVADGPEEVLRLARCSSGM